MSADKMPTVSYKLKAIEVEARTLRDAVSELKKQLRRARIRRAAVVVLRALVWH